MGLRISKFGLLTVKFFLVHVLCPIFIGGLIYTLWRQPTLIIFSWYDSLGLGGVVAHLRSNTGSYRALLPNWFLFCLPDGLWVYAMTSFMAALWMQAPKPYLVFWVSLAPILAVGGELGQLLGLVQGTYEVTDIAFYVAGFVLAACVVFEKNKKANYEEHGLV